MSATAEIRKAKKAERHTKWLAEYVTKNKFFADPKFYKNNYWSIAHFESWAARGKAGSCSCGCGYYNGTLCNRRASAKSGGRENICRDVSANFCDECIRQIETILGQKFKREYAP